jgi:hypothetical protein
MISRMSFEKKMDRRVKPGDDSGVLGKTRAIAAGGPGPQLLA